MKVRNPSAKSSTKPAADLSLAASTAKDDSFPIVGIGASAGGLDAFRQLLGNLPGRTGMAFVLVQHLDPKHESALPEILARTCKLPISEVRDSTLVVPDHAYVIPADRDMAVMHGVLHLLARTTRGPHLPVDYFFRSLAEDRGEKAIAVVLSGTASDGAQGCMAVKAAGGITFAQDEKSAKFFDMPNSAIATGCVDFVLPPKAIASELVGIGHHPYLKCPEAVEPGDLLPHAGKELSEIFISLRNFCSVDFTHYKQGTLHRRIKRRMALLKLYKLKDYVGRLRSSPGELEALYKDFLIHVTGFFRDPDTFLALQRRVFPKLLEHRRSGQPIRLWVPACSTGEEAYSLAICLLEFLGNAAGPNPLQIFATDISESAVATARAGIYRETIATDVSLNRLQRFFVKIDDGYKISKAIREMCVFAEHNVFKDPPFSRLDLISCRNLLIYLDPVLQKKVISIFHYALKPNGVLTLGNAETLSRFADHFVLLDRKHKIYSRKNTTIRPAPSLAGVDYRAHKIEPRKSDVKAEFAIDKEVDRILLMEYAPASVVVNDDLEILRFRGHTGAFLEAAPGEARLNLTRMAREGLLINLRLAVNKARKENARVRKEGVRIPGNGHVRTVNFEVVPIRGTSSTEQYFLILFQDATPAKARKRAAFPVKGTSKLKLGARDSHIAELEQELGQTREHLQEIIEEYETKSEEFNSEHEEILSSNEELQSTNEELETAKEELQSGNEELTTLNEELQNRTVELAISNSDLANLLNSVNIPIVMLGTDLCIRHFTSPARNVLNLLPTDMGRRIGDIRPNVDLPDLEKLVADAIDTATLQEREVRDRHGHWYLLRIRPYKTAENKTDGAVVSLLDIDALIRNLDQSRRFAEMIIETAREALLVLDERLRVKVANRSFYRTFDTTAEETENQFIYDLGDGQWNIPQLRTLLEEVLPGDTQVIDFEVEHDFELIGRKMMLLNARRIEADIDRHLILLAIQDITDRKKAENEVHQLSARMLHLQDEERRHIARELHDSTGQKIAAMILHLAVLSQRSAELGPKERDALSECFTLGEQAIGEMRTLSYLLHPPLLDEAGLVAAIRWYADGVTQRSGIQIDLELSPESGRLPQEIEIVLFRIVQETLTNIHLHSGSRKARIRLDQDPNEVTLEVSDEGRGMPSGVLEHRIETTRTLGVGIVGMRERVRQLGGRLEIHSSTQGTIVKALLPVQHRAA